MSGIENNKNGGPEHNQEDILPVFINEGTAGVRSHRSVPYRVQKQAPNRESKLPEILDKIKDPNFSVAEVTRLIAVEMTLIVQDMRAYESDGAAAFKLKSCVGQIRVLRAAAKAVQEADACAKRDVLDFDGPKFKFAFGEIVKYFKKAAQEALGGNETTVQSIMKHFRDIIGAHDADLRRATACVAVQSVKGQEESKQAAQPSAASTTAAAPSQDAPASISITSNPDAAEIYVDDAFDGNTPATLKLSPGKHTIRVSLTAYKAWSREITVQAGSEAHLVATLEKLN